MKSKEDFSELEGLNHLEEASIASGFSLSLHPHEVNPPPSPPKSKEVEEKGRFSDLDFKMARGDGLTEIKQRAEDDIEVQSAITRLRPRRQKNNPEEDAQSTISALEVESKMSSVSERIDHFLKHGHKELEEMRKQKRRRTRKMPKFERRMPKAVFLRVLRCLPFKLIFTKYALLNHQTRTIIFSNYADVCHQRLITVDLSGTTKILKKLPPHMAKRLNYIKIVLKPDATNERILRLIQFAKPLLKRVRIQLEAIDLDDSDKLVLDRIKAFAPLPIYEAYLKKCNLQEKATQINLLQDAIILKVSDCFLKFHVKDMLQAQEVYIKKSTIIYGKNSMPILQEMLRFQVTDSHIKNTEFVWRPSSERLEHLILLKNDYFGLLKFDVLKQLLANKRKFVNLKSVNCECQVDEDSLIEFLKELKDFHQLQRITMQSPGVFFHMKEVLGNPDIKLLKIFDYPHKIRRVDATLNQLVVKFQLPGDYMNRLLDFTYKIC